MSLSLKSKTFFVDCETDGLYGKFLSIAAVVADNSGSIEDEFYMAIKCEIDDIENNWVKENVYDSLKSAYQEAEDEDDLLEAFWRFWLKYRENTICVAFVQYPVEARLFSSCINKDFTTRALLGPYPLYDLSTLLYSVGIDTKSVDMNSLSGLDLISHDAMNDVKMMAAVWNRIINKR